MQAGRFELLELSVGVALRRERERPSRSDPEEPDPLLRIAGWQMCDPEIPQLANDLFGGHLTSQGSRPSNHHVAAERRESRDPCAVGGLRPRPRERGLAEVAPGEVSRIVGEECTSKHLECVRTLEIAGRQIERVLGEALGLADNEAPPGFVGCPQEPSECVDAEILRRPTGVSPERVTAVDR